VGIFLVVPRILRWCHHSGLIDVAGILTGGNFLQGVFNGQNVNLTS
jgi:hypothetical protein